MYHFQSLCIYISGLFCALTICDVNPCVFGTCELTSEDFRCVCQQGYQGKLCDKKVKPCSTNPCEGRGECIEKNNFTFMCQCHAWWEGISIILISYESFSNLKFNPCKTVYLLWQGKDAKRKLSTFRINHSPIEC